MKRATILASLAAALLVVVFFVALGLSYFVQTSESDWTAAETDWIAGTAAWSLWLAGASGLVALLLVVVQVAQDLWRRVRVHS
ncbi:hypothetical protein AB0O95_10445 [Rhodoglobus sp. NPDC076762]